MEYAERGPLRNMPLRRRLLHVARAAMVPPMFRHSVAAAQCALLFALCGCGQNAQDDPSQGVARFLSAVLIADHAGFEASLDRPALRSDLREQLVGIARANGTDVDGGPSDFALDRMITPQAFRLVEARTGQPLSTPPSAARVAPMMKVRDRDHVCVGGSSPDRCVLSFANQKGAWRLVGMQATDLTIEVPPEPTTK